jgi:S1-C subfamily serine protease
MLIQGAFSGDLEPAIEAKRLYASNLLHRQNVVACGVGLKESEGQLLNEPCVIVSVTHKVPKAQLSPDDLVPQILGSVRTDVQQVGVFRAWQGPTGRYRPAVPGISCGHIDVTAGTFGCLVHRGDDTFILSNNHVLANVNNAAQGDPIIQPGRYDGGTPDDQIAVLEDWISIQTGVKESDCPWATRAASLLNALANVTGSSSRMVALQEQPAENKVDCAIARPLSPDLVQPAIQQIGVPKGVREGQLGIEIQKSGRTTGYTTGRITQIEVTVQVDYQGQMVTFVDQFMATAMSAGGDSGSAVLDMDGYVVGLLFAGSDMATLINPIQDVLDALNVQVVSG